MLGLSTANDTAAFWRQNTRRLIVRHYPNGSAPLLALLSLADKKEPTPSFKHSWPEERFESVWSSTITGPTSNVVFYGTGTTTSSGSTLAVTAGTTYRIYIKDATTTFLANDNLRISRLPVTSGGYTAAVFRVVSTGNTSGTGDYIEGYAVNTTPTINNAAATVGCHVLFMGSAHREGSGAGSGRSKVPILVENYTQIHKNPFELTRAALAQPLIYNESSDYENVVRYNGHVHMTGIEQSMIFGERKTILETVNGKQVRRNFMGGILWFLKQWELGNTTNGGEFDYRPGGADLTAETDWLANPDKRLIDLWGASMSRDAFEELEALPFQACNPEEVAKLCLCGPGYLSKISRRFRKEIQQVQLPGQQFKEWNFELVARRTGNGTIYYKTHPLFQQSNSPFRNSALYVDTGHLNYVPFENADTKVIEGIQLPDEDIRKDMFMTECGFELELPESCMWVNEIGEIAD